MPVLAAQPPASSQGCTVYRMWGEPVPFWAVPPSQSLGHHEGRGTIHGRSSLSLNLYYDQEGALGMRGGLP